MNNGVVRCVQISVSQGDIWLMMNVLSDNLAEHVENEPAPPAITQPIAPSMIKLVSPTFFNSSRDITSNVCSSS
jgi:hypothetical protein